MTVYVADHSYSFVDSARLKAAGYSGDIGYCSHDPGKNWTPAQIKDRLAAGIRVGVVWETTAQRAAYSGAQGGTQDGGAYLSQAQMLGATGGTLWVCLEDPTVLPQSEWPNVVAYTQAVAATLKAAGFEVGGYGSDALLSHVRAAGHITRKWSVETWPRGNWGPHLQQLANSHPLDTFGGAVDCNIAVADWGQTLFFGASNQGDSLSAEDVTAIEGHIDATVTAAEANIDQTVQDTRTDLLKALDGHTALLQRIVDKLGA